jgi:hypothetical protein
MNINAQPVAGDDGDVTVCDSSTDAIDLFSLITGEQAGGTWTRTSGTGGTFDAAAGTYTPATGATTSTFTYTLVGTAPCVDDSSVATININAQPVAGDDGDVTVCENSAEAINLFDLITGEQAGGTWTRTSGTGGTFNAAAGTYTPAMGATSSTFTYTLAGTAPCVDDSSVATVNITPMPTAEISYEGQPLCNDTFVGTVAVTLTGTGAYLGGTFSSTAGLAIDPVTGAITPSESLAGTYTVTYTIPASGGCPADAVTTTVVVEACAEGCTLGYWKNHIDRWCSAYSPTMTYGSVFANAPANIANLTLLQALNLGGGGVKNLARQSVAALLNACSDEVTYPLPYADNPQSVIDAVNAAFLAGGNAPGQLATALDNLNNTGCPLGGTPATGGNGGGNGNAGNGNGNGNGNGHNHRIAAFTAHPVPFKDQLSITYEFDSTAPVTVEVFDSRGRLLSTQVDRAPYNGKEIKLDTTAMRGEGQLFFIKVVTEEGFQMKKVISGIK